MTQAHDRASERADNVPSETEVVPIDQLVRRFGSGRHPERPPAHERPEGVDDATVEALALLGKSLEDMEAARGFLYEFHRLSGRADLDLQDAVDALRKAGHGDVADVIDEVLVGRDVLPGMWTFQIMEGYDTQYAEVFRTVERSVRHALGVATPHLGEAEMKAREQS